MPGAPDQRPGPIRRVYARSASWLGVEVEQLEAGAPGTLPRCPRARRPAAGRSGLRQRAANLWPPFCDGVRVEAEPRPDPAAEAETAELVGVLVDEPDCDVVVLGDAASGPEPVVVGSDRLGARGLLARTGDRPASTSSARCGPSRVARRSAISSASALTNRAAGSAWRSALSRTTVAVTPAASCSAPGTRRPSRPCR